MSTDIVINSTCNLKQQVYTKKSKSTAKIAGDNIFAGYARKAGLNGFANFLRDDWVEKTAEKFGFKRLANWLKNDDDSNFTENTSKWIVKHPLLTIASATALFFMGKHVIKTIKSKNAVQNTQISNIKPPETVKPATQDIEPIKPFSEQVEVLRKTIEEGTQYEKSIGYKNLDIFKNLTDEERIKIVKYFELTKREQELLLFASGSKPATIESYGSITDSLFDSLRSDKVTVTELFLGKDKNIIYNNAASKQVIKDNKDFFIQRLELKPNSTVDEIFDSISKSLFCNKFSDSVKYNDLKLMLQGETKKNACLAQIFYDIQQAEKHKHLDIGIKTFYEKSALGIEEFKQAYKNGLSMRTSSYSGMDSFKDYLKKLIDSISLKDYKDRLEDPFRLIEDSEYKNLILKALKNLAQKLENAQKYGSSIGF